MHDVREDADLRVGQRDLLPRTVEIAQPGHAAQEAVDGVPMTNRPMTLVTNTPSR